MNDEMDWFKPLLENPRTLIYVCGLEGMQLGLYRLLMRHNVADGYLKVSNPDDLGKGVKVTPRCMLEVY